MKKIILPFLILILVAIFLPTLTNAGLLFLTPIKSAPSAPLPWCAQWGGAGHARLSFSSLYDNGGGGGDGNNDGNGNPGGCIDFPGGFPWSGAWTITDGTGYSVTDTFTLSGSSTVKSIVILVWLTPGDNITQLDVSIGTNAFGSDILSNTYIYPIYGTYQDFGGNSYGFDQVSQEFLIPDTAMSGGIYWITLQNAVSSYGTGYPVFWGENNGASVAQENTMGAIPSEAFAIGGTQP